MTTEPTMILACVRGIGGRIYLAGIVKRTYSYTAEGRLRLADKSSPVVTTPVVKIDSHGLPRYIEDDTDVLPPKPATDVVLKGSAYSRAPRSEWVAAVAVGSNVRVLRILGERHAEVKAGRVRLPPPSLTTQVALRWELAYGGVDLHALMELTRPPRGIDFVATAPEVIKEGLFAYPRNRVGCAYFIDIDRARVEGAELPQMEEPSDPLVAERFFVPKPKAWIDAPLPGGMGWVPYSWYPRIVRLLGPVLAHDAPCRPVAEAQLADGRDLIDVPVGRGCLPRAIQGAVPGLAIERLRGNEAMALRGLDSEVEDLRMMLPGEVPRMEMKPPGTNHIFRPTSVLQTVRVDTETRHVSLTWCGAVRLVCEMSPEQVQSTLWSVKW